MSNKIKLYTIGFTQKSAEQFFDTLLKANVRNIIDTRLNNVSQLAGFTKQKDLQYFLHKIGRMEYSHRLDLAPTKEILDDYKKKRISWATYEERFNKLITERQIERDIVPSLLDGGCLLCSEAKPHYCHRRLVAEHLQKKLGQDIEIHHL